LLDRAGHVHERLGSRLFAATHRLLLAAAGVLFVLYPAVRPWRDESTVDGAIAAMSSGAWVASHLFAMVGFILVSLALLALRDAVAGTRGESVATTTASPG